MPTVATVSASGFLSVMPVDVLTRMPEYLGTRALVHYASVNRGVRALVRTDVAAVRREACARVRWTNAGSRVRIGSNACTATSIPSDPGDLTNYTAAACNSCMVLGLPWMYLHENSRFSIRVDGSNGKNAFNRVGVTDGVYAWAFDGFSGRCSLYHTGHVERSQGSHLTIKQAIQITVGNLRGRDTDSVVEVIIEDGRLRFRVNGSDEKEIAFDVGAGRAILPRKLRPYAMLTRLPESATLIGYCYSASSR